MENRADLGGTLEEILTYSLTSSDSKMQVVFRFRDNQLSKYQLVLIEGAPIYSVTQPSIPLDEAKGVLARLSVYENAPYIKNMTDMLNMMVGSAANLELVSGNLKLNTTSVGEATQYVWIYTENGVDFSPKTFDLVFSNQVMTDLIDDMFLFTIGSTAVNISADKAVSIARDQLGSYKVLEPPTVLFHPNTRNSLVLYPYWSVTFTLNGVYENNVNTINIGVWADTGQVARVKTYAS